MSIAIAPADIIKGNKLIAEFLGFDKIPEGHFNEMNPRLQYYGNMDQFGTVVSLMSENDLKYHTSWDWLMPVVEKIESKKFDEWGYKVWMGINSTSITSNRIGNFEINEANGSRIKATWQAVVQFIQWYNNQNRQP